MKNILLLACAISFLSSTNLNAQVDPEFSAYFENYEILTNPESTVINTIEGSPYHHDEFKTGSILLSDGKEFKDLLLRFNVFKNQIEMKSEKGIFVIQNIESLSSISIESQTLRFFPSNKIYLEKAIEGRLSLYIKYNITYKPPLSAGPYQKESKPRYISQKPVYLIGLNNNRPIEIHSEKDLRSSFKDLETIIDEYSGKKKLKLKKVEDYINLLNYINKGQ
ncbi:MAG: hypothetical protein QNK33_04215 [Bacteroidales bacterium]|nr:hypothetical protein [Bacteroidales bacterium]